MYVLRKYGVATRIRFPLVEAGAQDFKSGATVDAGDFKISKDDGAAVNPATTTPTEIVNIDAYYLPLSVAEMEAANIVIQCTDQTVTKEWEDQQIIIDTYGHPSAQHAMDLDDAIRGGMTALPNAAADAAGGLPISDVGGLDLDAVDTNINTLFKFIKNKKELLKIAAVWYLITYDDNSSTEIMRKAIKDKDGNNISDLVAGELAQELKSTV